MPQPTPTHPQGIDLSSAPQRRSRRAAVGLLAAAALVVPVACAPGSDALPAETTGSSHAAPPATGVRAAASVRSCAALAASLSSDARIGQLLMVGISSSRLTSSQAKILARGRVGSVILLGNSTAGRKSIKRLSKKVHAIGGRPSGVAVMLTVDQEGGKVQRLRGSGFDRMPSAKSQAKLSSSQLTTKAERWARQLRAAGIDANLAPVADVVPKSMERANQPIGALQRGYGPNPDVVAAKGTAFIRGMHRGGVTTAVKHFPGLGRVRGNTDFTTRVVDKTTTRRDRGLKGFAAGSAAGVDMVMMSSAYYTKIDRNHRAVFSKVVIGQMLRRDLAFQGVVISDDLAARAVRDLSPGTRAVTFLKAGGDLIIVGDATKAPAMVKAIKAKAKSDRAFRVELQRKATRVLKMKARQGLTKCS